MANYASLISAIQADIKTNGSGEITGAVLQSILLSMVDSLGEGYTFVGVATALTDPSTPDEKVFYLAPAGTYSNFGLTVSAGCIGVLYYDGAWQKEEFTVISTQTAYSAKGTSTKVAQITTNTAGQVTAVSEVSIDFPVTSVNGSTGAVSLTIPDAQVQSNWTQSDNTKVDFIKNKPTIPTVPSNLVTGKVNGTNTALTVAVVSSMPATPDANTIYIVQ